MDQSAATPAEIAEREHDRRAQIPDRFHEAALDTVVENVLDSGAYPAVGAARILLAEFLTEHVPEDDQQDWFVTMVTRWRVIDQSEAVDRVRRELEELLRAKLASHHEVLWLAHELESQAREDA